MLHKYHKKDSFKTMKGAAVGLAGVGITTAVGAGIQAQAPAGTPSMMPAFNTLAGMSGIAVTASVGKSLLPKQKKSKYGF